MKNYLNFRMDQIFLSSCIKPIEIFDNMNFENNPPFRNLSEKNFWIVEALNQRREKRTPYGTQHAAVLIPLYEKAGELFIVLTKRTKSLKHHKGQISFPGGACQEGDSDVESTALRETFEEVGIRPEDVRVIGMLDCEKSKSSGYVVTPVVGLIPHPYSFSANRDEVDRIIEVPVATLYEKEGLNGLEYLYGIYRIWGLTARILKQLLVLRT